MKFENENWAQFKGEIWKREINVRDFIQNNYKPYEGDDSFLKDSSDKTKKVWDKLTEMVKVVPAWWKTVWKHMATNWTR